MEDLAKIFTGGDKPKPYVNFPQRNPNELYDRNGVPIIDPNVQSGRLATPNVWRQEAGKNLAAANPQAPNIGDYMTMVLQAMFAPNQREPRDDANAVMKMNAFQNPAPLDDRMQRIWGDGVPVRK